VQGANISRDADPLLREDNVVSQNVAKVVDPRSVGTIAVAASFTAEPLLGVIEPERLTPGVRVRAIVVYNASGNATAIAANSWSSWVTLIQARRNGGFAYGNNLAIQEAYSERPPDYVYLLNPVTVLRHGAVSVC
jgi:GT2 family glycosyltransferase